MKNRIVMWSRRDLSFSGKVYLLKSVIISLMLYASGVIYVPDSH